MARSPKDVPTSITSGSGSAKPTEEPTSQPTSDPQRDKTDPLSSPGTAEEQAADDQTSGRGEPDEEAIRRLAYEIWEREGKQPGRDEEYWHRAKEFLRARSA
jgi:hypothetical protein